MWGQSPPWHKVLNALVAELSIHKLKNSRRRHDERLGAKLRVTENECVLFNSLTYVYIYNMFIYTIHRLPFIGSLCIDFPVLQCSIRWSRARHILRQREKTERLYFHPYNKLNLFPHALIYETSQLDSCSLSSLICISAIL